MKRKPVSGVTPVLYFIAAGLWLITVCIDLSDGAAADWLTVLRCFTFLVSLAAGVVNLRRYRRDKNDKQESEH